MLPVVITGRPESFLVQPAMPSAGSCIGPFGFAEAARGNVEHVDTGRPRQRAEALQLIGRREDARAVIDLLELREAEGKQRIGPDGLAQCRRNASG